MRTLRGGQKLTRLPPTEMDLELLLLPFTKAQKFCRGLAYLTPRFTLKLGLQGASLREPSMALAAAVMVPEKPCWLQLFQHFLPSKSI